MNTPLFSETARCVWFGFWCFWWFSLPVPAFAQTRSVSPVRLATQTAWEVDEQHISTLQSNAWDTRFAVGSLMNGVVYAIAVDGTDVYVGGNFTDAGGNPEADNIARWDGSSWHALGTGLKGTVFSIVVSNGQVYAGGRFTDAGENALADHIARWDGHLWQALRTGLNGDVKTILRLCLHLLPRLRLV